MSEVDPKIEFFSELYEVLASERERVKDLRRALERRGIDVEEAVDAVRNLIEDHKGRRRREVARGRLEAVRGALRDWVRQGHRASASIREDLARALAGGGGDVAYQAYHRKLQRVTQEDLESLGEDAELLEFIERMEADRPE